MLGRLHQRCGASDNQMPNGCCAPSRSVVLGGKLGEWRIRSKSDLKNYPHFDPIISAKDAEALANDPDRVAKHSFFPFLRYVKHWTRYAKKGQLGKPKDRPIRYAARRDAYIFSRYRCELSEAYEAELVRLGISDSVLAYRRIPTESGDGGKCNIHFARDAILKVRELGDCCVLALDISSYFESLDHAKLKSLWCRMLSKDKLPADHFRVFKAITEYAYVDKLSVYERLGHYGDKPHPKTGKMVKGFLTPFGRIPKQLCRGREFQEKIAGENGQKSLIEKNFKPFGIPQGAPISDLLANLYLIDFDKEIRQAVDAVGGAYYRYSDDILIAVPGREADWKAWLVDVQQRIRDHGEKLVIKSDKSAVYLFSRNGVDQSFQRVHGTQGANGLEYLGFRYNGKHAYLRDSTLSGLWRKVTFSIRHDAHNHVTANPGLDVDELVRTFNYERLVKQFGKVEDFDEHQEDYRTWTFWTYASRSSDVFGELGKPIIRQLRHYSRQVRAKAKDEIIRVFKRDRSEASIPLLSMEL